MKDFHCHILPGIDDGAHDLSVTEKMLKRAAAAGIDMIAATSHYSPEGDTHYEEAWNEVLKLAEKYSVRLLKGTEYDLQYIADIPKDKLKTIGDTNYLLVDMNRNYIVHSMPNLFFELKLAGFEIIFAHPERLLSSDELMELLDLLEENRIFIQIDTGSITGRYGKAAQKNAFAILDRGGAYFLWNDAHNEKHFAFDECRIIFEKRYGKGIFELLTEENPSALLSDGPLSPMPKRKTFWSRFFHRA